MDNTRDKWIEEQLDKLGLDFPYEWSSIRRAYHKILLIDAMAVADAHPVEVAINDELGVECGQKILYVGTTLCPALSFATKGQYEGWLFIRHPGGQWVTIAKLPAAPPRAEGGMREALQRLIECIEAENVSGVPVKHSIATRFAIQDAKAAMNAPPAPVGEGVVVDCMMTVRCSWAGHIDKPVKNISFVPIKLDSDLPLKDGDRVLVTVRRVGA